MPKRPRPGGRRFTPRQRPKERRQSEPGEAVPARGVTPARIPEAPRRAEVPAGGFSVATTPHTKAAARHIVKDYSYVLGELRRIMIVLLVIVAGLVAAAVALR